MQFGYEITTPKNTTAQNPLVTRQELDALIITEIYLDIPKGCSGLVGVQIYALGRLIFPRNKEYWFKGDDVQKTFMCAWSVEDTPHDVEIYTYNLDDTYPHTIQIVFTCNITALGAVSISSSAGGGGGGGSGGYTPTPSPEPTPEPSPYPTPTPTPEPTPEPTPTPIKTVSDMFYLLLSNEA